MNWTALLHGIRRSSWKRWSCLGTCLWAMVQPSVGAVTTYVSNLLDSGTGSLRQAIHTCNAAGGGSILISNLVGTIPLVTELPPINANTVVEATEGSQVSISGGKRVRVLTINSGSLCVLRGLTITAGAATNEPGGGGILNLGHLTLVGCVVAENSAGENLCGACPGLVARGGGIYSVGRLTLLSSCVSNNWARGRTTALGGFNAYGGGVYAGGLTVISNSLLIGNSANGGSHNGQCCALGSGGLGYGGAIYSTANFNVFASLLANNGASGGRGSDAYAPGIGGGVVIASGAGAASIINSTLSRNQASWGGNLYCQEGNLEIWGGTIVQGIALHGAGIYSSINAGVRMQNTIVADNGRANEIEGPITSLGHNLIRTSLSSYDATDLVGFDPLLGPLVGSPGVVPTHALLPASPAIDAGINAGSAYDQRGQLRTVDQASYSNSLGGDGTDIGAYEVETQLPAVVPNLLVTTVADTGPGSLREAIINSNTTRSQGGEITFSNIAGVIFLSNALPGLPPNVTVRGPGSTRLTIDGQSHRIFAGSSNALSGLTLRRGNPAVEGEFAIQHCVFAECPSAVLSKTNLFIYDCTFADCVVYDSAVRPLGNAVIRQSVFIRNANSVLCPGAGGPALSTVAGQIVIEGCQFLSNTVNSATFSSCGGVSVSPLGGALLVRGGKVALTDCTFRENASSAVPQAYTGPHLNAYGGAIGMTNGSLNLTNCTLAGNQAVAGSSTSGWGGYCAGGAIDISGGSAVAVHCTFSGNRITAGAGGRSLGGPEPGGGATGGALAAHGASISLIHCTIASNSAGGGLARFPDTRHGTAAGGGVGIFFGGSVSMLNCLISGNLIMTNSSPLDQVVVGNDGSGAFQSRGHNLVTHAESMTGLGDQDLINVLPLLGPLRDNGGSVQTHMLLPGSPAIDAGVNAGFEFDQRLRRRTADNLRVDNARLLMSDGTDIGAVEADQSMSYQLVSRFGDDIRLSFSSDAQTVYGVQFKASLTNSDWLTLSSVVAGTGALVSYTDTNAALRPAGFYRLFERAP